MKKLLLILLLLFNPSIILAGRDCDGANDEIAFGSDTSIDEFTTRTFCAYVRSDDTGSTEAIWTKGAAANEVQLTSVGNDAVRYSSDWGTDGNWIGTTDVVNGTTFFHICIVYTNTATTNDPIIYVNGAVETLTTDTNPTGSRVSDAANELQLCETNNDALDFNGAIGWMLYTSSDIGASGVNRARWWGRSGGGLVVYHPLVTDKLTNEGTGTANGTAAGTTVVPVSIKVHRPGMGNLSGIGF